MNRLENLIFACALVALSAALRAAVPVAWTNAPGMAPHLIGPYPHGSSIDFAVTLRGYTEPPIAAGADLRMWFQTNGMGKAWFSAPASLDGNVITSTFGPAQDTGADRVSLFFGAPSNAFAPAVLRLTHAPGFRPNALPLPVQTLDFTTVAYTNAPWLTGAEVDMRIQELAPRADLSASTNYTDSATNRLVQLLTDPDEFLQVARAETSSFSVSAEFATSAHRADLSDGLIKIDDDEYRSTDQIFSQIDARTTTNDVCAIVTNEAPTGPLGEWALVSVPTGTEDQWSSLSVVESQSDPGTWDVTVVGPGSEPCVGSFQGDSDVMTAELYVYEAWDVQQGVSYRIGIARTRQPRNALGLARLADLPTNHVTRAEMEEAIDAIPEVDLSRLATKSEFAAVSNESALVTRLYTSSNVLLEVTNFNSAVHSPKLRLLQLDESNTYHTVWSETNNLARTLAAATGYTVVAVSNAERRAASAYAPRAWSGVTSGLGVEAPKNTTWISTPTTVIAGGLEYAKVVHSGGAIWVLSGNGMMQFDPTTNAYLRISADDGTEIFSIEKTDAVTVGAHAAGITVVRSVSDGVTIINIPVNVVSDKHPTMHYRQSLNDAAGWISEEDFHGTLGNIYWSGQSGAWHCEIKMGVDAADRGFFKFTYEQPGSTLIKNGAPMDVSGGIMCTDGVHKVRPVYNNGSITWEVVQ